MGLTDTEKTVRQVLQRDFGFSLAHAAEAFEQLARQPVVFGTFLAWLENRGTLPEIHAAGYSLHKLVSDYRMTPVGAFLTLAWLLEEPIEATAALAQGYDEIKFAPGEKR